VFRFSRGSPYEDTDRFVAALVEAFTIERCIWGSDWPFLRAKERTDFGPLLAALHRVVPDAADREKVLWTNPARLFRMAA
jgi:predicted TIM-barrel fold metal-dependent hydrolase